MEPILKDLCVLVRKSTIHYLDTCPQNDVELNNEFKDRYNSYLSTKNYTVDFYEHTAVISTSAKLYMYISNQWFVVASYALGVYLELAKYKNYLLDVCMKLGEKPKKFIPSLRNAPNSKIYQDFCYACKNIFEGSEEEIQLATKRLWRFATDYTWWSGNKTIDRGDFYLSVVLNMLNLVNASQGYIGEMVADYCNSGISTLVSKLENFTDSHEGSTYIFEDYDNPMEKNVELYNEKKSEKILQDEDDDVIVIRTRK